MAAILRIDFGPVSHQAYEVPIRIREHDDPLALPPCDLEIVLARGLPRHVLQRIFAEALDHLCATDVPRLRPPPRRVTA